MSARALGAAVCVMTLAAGSAAAADAVAWTSAVNVTVGAGIRKTAGCEGCTDAGAISAQEITGDGFVEFVPAVGWRMFAGLGKDRSASTAPTAIDFAFSFWPDGTWDVRELGVYRKGGTYVAGDVFRVAVENRTVRYYQNGTQRYASTVVPPAVLGFDSTFYKKGAELVSVSMSLPRPITLEPDSGPIAEPGTPAATGQGITDRLVRPEPPLPVLGPAGFAFVDPVFGSRMLRVTDAQTRPGVPDRSYKTPSTSHQNAWNTTGTRFYALGSNGALIPFDFDPATMSAKRIAPTTTGDGGLTLKFAGEPQFSYVHEDLIFGPYSGAVRTIAEYNFTTNQYAMLLNLDTVGAVPGTYVGGTTSSAGPVEKISVFYGGAAQDSHFRVVVFERDNPSRRRVLDTVASTIDGVPTATPLNFRLHHSQIDLSGRYVMLSPRTPDRQAPRYAPAQVVWDTLTGTITELPTAARSGGHDALGFGIWINKDCCTASSWDAAQWQMRHLSNPLATRDLIAPVQQPKEVYLSDHVSWNNADPNRLLPIVTAPYRYGNNTTPWRAWDDEIIALQTDNANGGATVWRYGHHRSDVSADADPLNPYFWYMPRVNVSQTGRFALFTSNWEKTLGVEPGGAVHRQDLFLIELKGMPASVANQLPTVAVTAPVEGAVLVAGTMTRLAVDATDADGVVRDVTFEVNGVTIGTVSTAPFSMVWAASEAGAYAIRATARDSAGETASSAVVNVRVERPNQAPTVAVGTTATGRVQMGGTVDLQASAGDVDGFISRVDFFVNGQAAGTAVLPPFAVPYTPAAPGTYSVTAVAVDDDGASTSSEAATFEVTEEIVIYAADVARTAGDFALVADATAAAGMRLWNPNRGVSRPPVAVNPVSYAEFTFYAVAGRPYQLWMRGRADSNNWANDSAYVQFSTAVDALQRPLARIGTTQAMSITVEQAVNAGLSGWGWTDNTYGGPGVPFYFATTGLQTIRIQQREDGLSMDQIVISPAQYFAVSPGAGKNDGTVVSK